MSKSLDQLGFDDSQLKGISAEKQPYIIVKWLSRIYILLVESQQEITGQQQRFVSDQLIKLIDYIGNAPEKDQIASKNVRLQIGKVYRAVYDGESIHYLYETVNKLVSLLNSSGDKYNIYKQ